MRTPALYMCNDDEDAERLVADLTGRGWVLDQEKFLHGTEPVGPGMFKTTGSAIRVRLLYRRTRWTVVACIAARRPADVSVGAAAG